MNSQYGGALVISIIIMAILSALIIGFSQSTDIDLLVGRNARILKQAFNWSDSGFELAQEAISISEDKRGIGDTTPTTYEFLGSNNLYKTVTNTIYNSTSSNMTIRDEDSTGAILSTVRIRLLGTVTNDGSSVIFAAGYEGVGKGAGAGGTIARIYSLRSEGRSDTDSVKRSAGIYSSVSSGK